MNNDHYVVDVNEADFNDSVIEASINKLIIVDFWAPWCGPCKQLTPILEKVIKNVKNNPKISFEKNNPQFEIRGSLIELLNSLVSKKLNKNLIFGNSELAIVFVNIILKSNIDIIYLIDKYFGNTSAVFAYSVLKLFKSSDNDSDIEYENIRKRLREISIKLDRLEAIKGI